MKQFLHSGGQYAHYVLLTQVSFIPSALWPLILFHSGFPLISSCICVYMLQSNRERESLSLTPTSVTLVWYISSNIISFYLLDLGVGGTTCIVGLTMHKQIAALVLCLWNSKIKPYQLQTTHAEHHRPLLSSDSIQISMNHNRSNAQAHTRKRKKKPFYLAKTICFSALSYSLLHHTFWIFNDLGNFINTNLISNVWLPVKW